MAHSGQHRSAGPAQRLTGRAKECGLSLFDVLMYLNGYICCFFVGAERVVCCVSCLIYVGLMVFEELGEWAKPFWAFIDLHRGLQFCLSRKSDHPKVYRLDLLS